MCVREISPGDPNYHPSARTAINFYNLTYFFECRETINNICERIDKAMQLMFLGKDSNGEEDNTKFSLLGANEICKSTIDVDLTI